MSRPYINQKHFNSIQIWSFQSFSQDALSFIRHTLKNKPSLQTIEEIKEDLVVLKNGSDRSMIEKIIQKWVLRGIDSEIALLNDAIEKSKR